MKRAKAVFLPLFFAIAPSAFALDVGTDTGDDVKASKERTVALRQVQDIRESATKRLARSKSTGSDSTTSESWRSTGQSGQSGEMSVTVDPMVFFIKSLRDYEAAGVEPFASCRVASHPRLPADFGLSAEVGPGAIDTIKASYIRDAAGNNMPVADLANEVEIKAYRDCLAFYGAILQQANISLGDSIKKLKASVKNRQGQVEVKGIGLADYEMLAAGSLLRAVEKREAAERKYQSLLTNEPCRFAGRPEDILCGPLELHLGSQPKLTAGSTGIYGNGYGGVSGQYRITSSWSMVEALESAKSNAKYAKFAKEWQDAAERQEADGKTTEAAMTRRKAVELMKSNKTSLSPGRFLPGSN